MLGFVPQHNRLRGGVRAGGPSAAQDTPNPWSPFLRRGALYIHLL